MTAISDAAFTDAQEQELHNWVGQTGNRGRLLYELVEHSEIEKPLRRAIGDAGLTIDAALEVGVGCFGLGFLGPHLSDICGRIDGIDPLPRQTLDPADPALRAYLEAIQDRVHYVQCAGEELPLKTDGYDLVSCINVVDHAQNPVAILKEIHRVLRPGGLLAFSVSTLSKAGELKWKVNRKRHPDNWLFRAHPHTYQWNAADDMVRSLFPDVLWNDEPSGRSKLIGKGRMSSWIVRN